MDSTESGSGLVMGSREDGGDSSCSVNINEFLVYLHGVKRLYNRENAIPRTSWIYSET
jgi:hypothetical protein